MYRAQAEAWLASVRGTARDTRLTGFAEALRDLAVCDAARASAATGQWQEVGA